MNGGRLNIDPRQGQNVAVLLRAVAEKIARPFPGEASMLSQLSVFILNPPSGGCPNCGAPLPPNARTGRPRKYCVSCSPRKTPGKVKA